MLWDVVFGAVTGGVTCCFLFHHLGLVNYELIMKLIVGYTEEQDFYSNIQTNQDFSVQAGSLRSAGNVINKGRIDQIEAIEKNVRFPCGGPAIGEREPLWSHRYSAKLEAAAFKIYQAWREGEADGWTLSTNHKNELRIFVKKRTVGPDIVKSVFRIPYPVDSIITEVRDMESLLKFDATAKDCKKLATYGQGGGVQCTFLKSPSPLISPRDMVFAYDCCHLKDENIILSPAASVAFVSCPKNPGKIRTELDFGGWVFQVISPDCTMATYIVAADLKGSIPAWIVNQTTEDIGRTPLNLCKFMEEKYGTYNIPEQLMKSKVKHLSPVQGDADGLVYGTEDDMDDSIEDSKEESLEPIADPTGTETRSSTGLVRLGECRLTTHEQATMVTKLNLTIADVEKFTDDSSKKLWERMSSKDNGVKIYKLKDGKSGCMGKSIVKFEAQKIFEALKEPSFRVQFDPMLKSLRVVEQIGDLYVVHMHHQTKNCMAKIHRDLLVVWGSKQVGSKYVVAGTSITHPGCPMHPRMKRIDIDVCGWVVEEYKKRPGYSLVHFVLANIDYGQLPENVVTYINKRQVATIHDLALAIKRQDENAI